MGIALADVLDRMHGTGLLHRDVIAQGTRDEGLETTLSNATQ